MDEKLLVSSEVVKIPSNIGNLVMMAADRWGVGVIFAVVFGFATQTVYRDMMRQNTEMIVAMRANTRAVAELAVAVRNNNVEIQRINQK